MMSKIHTRRGGFTLIELMIVVAIIGILAAIAIPNFLKFQLKAKTSEGKTNLAAIRTAEESVFAEYGAYVSADASPAVAPANNKAPFVDAGAAGMNFDGLGWTPEGDVYFIYGVAANATGVAFTARPTPTSTATRRCRPGATARPSSGARDRVEGPGRRRLRLHRHRGRGSRPLPALVRPQRVLVRE